MFKTVSSQMSNVYIADVEQYRKQDSQARVRPL